MHEFGEDLTLSDTETMKESTSYKFIHFIIQRLFAISFKWSFDSINIYKKIKIDLVDIRNIPFPTRF